MLARAIRKRRGQGGDKRGTAFNTPAKPEGGDDGVKDGADEETKPRRRKKKGKGLSRQIYGLHNVIFLKTRRSNSIQLQKLLKYLMMMMI